MRWVDRGNRGSRVEKERKREKDAFRYATKRDSFSRLAREKYRWRVYYKWMELGLEIWKRKKKGRVVWPEIGAVAVAPRDPSSVYKNARINDLPSPHSFHYPRTDICRSFKFLFFSSFLIRKRKGGERAKTRLNSKREKYDR